jgi:hypothetical protein
VIRRLFNVLAVVSLVLCVALVALAARSCWIVEQFSVVIGQATVVVKTQSGEITAALVDEQWAQHYVRRPTEPSDVARWKMIRFQCQRGGAVRFVVMFPNWAMALPLGCLAWWFRRKGRKQSPQGFALQLAHEKTADESTVQKTSESAKISN